MSAAAPAGCAEDEPDPPGFVRPSVWELIRLRNAELRDRLPQLSRDASPDLRAGLVGLSAADPDPALERLRAAPDRDRDGFDVAVAGLLNAASRALADGDLEAAARRATRAVEEAPADPGARALRAMVLREQGRERAAWETLAPAFAGTPDEPAIALLHARLSEDVGEHAAAREAIDAYLREVPEDARVTGWRARVRVRAELTETHARRSWNGVEVLWPDQDPRATPIDALMETVDGAMRAMARVMGVARRPELTVVVYRAREEMRSATCSPEWTGAVFDGALHVDLDRLADPDGLRTVRHEATHAQLALARGPIPFWLNEGVAQWMEGPITEGKARRLAALASRGVWIPFASLEGPFLVIDDPADAGFAYDQSLVMVRWLVEREGQRAIADALRLVAEGDPHDLLTRLSPDADGRALLGFAGELADRARLSPRPGTR